MITPDKAEIQRPKCDDYVKASQQEDGYICALYINPGDVIDAYLHVMKNENSGESYNIRIIFSGSGTQKLRTAQGRGVSQPIVIYAGQESISKPVVSELIEGNEIELSGGFSFEKAKELVEKFKKLKQN